MVKEVIIDDSRQISVNQMIVSLFGMSVEELTREIREDTSGKYSGILRKDTGVAG